MTVRTSWKRMASDGLMAFATAATVAVALLLLATGPIYADAVSLGALRSTLHAAAAEDTTLHLTALVSPTGYDQVDELTTLTATGAIDPIGSTVRRSLQSNSYRLPTRPGADLDELVIFRSVDGLAGFTELVGGDWETLGAVGDVPLSVGVGIDERIAETLGLAVGDRVDITATGPDPANHSVEIAAVYRIIDPFDRYWTHLGHLVDGGSTSSLFRTYPLVTTADATIRLSSRLDAGWYVEPDLDGITLDRVAALRGSTSRLEDRLNAEFGRRIGDPSVVSTVEVETGLPGLLGRSERSITVTRSGVYGVVFQLTVLGGYALVLIAAIAVETRRDESSLLRARGARPRDLGLIRAAEAAIVTIPLVLVAPDLAAWILRIADDVGPLASIDLSLAPRPNPTSRLFALCGGAAVMAVLVLPVLRGARRAERLVGASRESSTSASQRAGLDLALLALAVIAFWQLTTLGDERAASVRGRFGVDPLLITAPALGLLAGVVISLRVVPLAARGAETVARRTRRVVGALVGWQVARRPSRYARSLLLLVAAVAVGVLATTFTATWRASQVAQATHQIGADARVSPNRRTGDSIVDLQLGAAFESNEGIELAVAAERWATDLPGSERRAVVVVLAADRARDVIRTHDARSAAAVDAALAELAGFRPAVETVSLPGRPHGIGATVEVIEAETVIDEQPIPPAVTTTVELVLRDGAGLLHRVPLGSVSPGDTPVEMTADLTVTVDGRPVAPRAPLSILSIEARWTTPEVTAREATVVVSAISVVDAGGERSALTGFADHAWSARASAFGFTTAAPSVIAVASSDGIRLGIGSGFGPQQVAVVAAAGPAGGGDLEAVPVAVSERYLRESGSRIGDRLRLPALGSRFDDLEIVTTVPEFPTVDPLEQEAIIIDLPTLQLASATPGGTIDDADEYWLDLRAVGDAVEPVLEAEPFDVVDFEALDRRADQLTSDPPSVGTLGAMSIGFVAAIVFAGVGFVAGAAVSARERSDEFATLRALGLSRRQLVRWLAIEQSLVALSGTVLGLLVGLSMSALLLPRISLTQSGDAVFPPVRVDIPWVSVGVLVGIVAVLTVLVIVAIHSHVVERDRSGAGEDT